MDTLTRVQIQDEAVCILHSANTWVERYEYNYSPSSYEETEEQSEFFSLGMATSIGEENQLNSAWN